MIPLRTRRHEALRKGDLQGCWGFQLLGETVAWDGNVNACSDASVSPRFRHRWVYSEADDGGD